jgi:hypothetical protein
VLFALFVAAAAFAEEPHKKTPPAVPPPPAKAAESLPPDAAQWVAVFREKVMKRWNTLATEEKTAHPNAIKPGNQVKVRYTVQSDGRVTDVELAEKHELDALAQVSLKAMTGLKLPAPPESYMHGRPSFTSTTTFGLQNEAAENTPAGMWIMAMKRQLYAHWSAGVKAETKKHPERVGAGVVNVAFAITRQGEITQVHALDKDKDPLMSKVSVKALTGLKLPPPPPSLFQNGADVLNETMSFRLE